MSQPKAIICSGLRARAGGGSGEGGLYVPSALKTVDFGSTTSTSDRFFFNPESRILIPDPGSSQRHFCVQYRQIWLTINVRMRIDCVEKELYML